MPSESSALREGPELRELGSKLTASSSAMPKTTSSCTCSMPHLQHTVLLKPGAVIQQQSLPSRHLDLHICPHSPLAVYQIVLMHSQSGHVGKTVGVVLLWHANPTRLSYKVSQGIHVHHNRKSCSEEDPTCSPYLVVAYFRAAFYQGHDQLEVVPVHKMRFTK